MNQLLILNLFVITFVSASLTSCALDPAEELAHHIEAKARELDRSTPTTIAFDFVPDEAKLKEAPRYKGDVTLRVWPDKTVTHATNGSTISVNNWYGTNYQSRFVQVTKEMKVTKALGMPFRIVLEKSGSGIFWTDLK
ncbi:MAG: hypothetical protein ACI8UO_003365 [Verrucomicrobiales bacterium]|jgi:hypothetical protein